MLDPFRHRNLSRLERAVREINAILFLVVIGLAMLDVIALLATTAPLTSSS
jgi:hypothetical protein